VTVFDGWGLAAGTLTVLPVGAPRDVDAHATRTAMMLAPAAVVPLGATVAAVGFAGRWLGLPALVLGLQADPLVDGAEPPVTRTLASTS
jgi:adenosylcobinamide-GDP ribazoletransferase